MNICVTDLTKLQLEIMGRVIQMVFSYGAHLMIFRSLVFALNHLVRVTSHYDRLYSKGMKV